jgi:hypothetical protein
MKMKFANAVTGFQPIVITIETPEELAWLLAVSNTALTRGRVVAGELQLKTRITTEAQRALWDGLQQYRSFV